MSDVNEKMKNIKDHWNNWALEYGENLRATTKSSNIKKLEIKVLLDSIIEQDKEINSILEVGCGNGFNAISIAKNLECKIDAFDYIDEMIVSANENKDALEDSVKENLNFFVGDVLNISTENKYDLIYSCRCLINLPNFELQKKAIKSIISILEEDGVFLMLENFVDNHANQNDIRESVGLNRREVAEFNNFFVHQDLMDFLPSINCRIVDVVNFSSLHDIAQYVLTPMMNNGVVDYTSDVVSSVTTLLLSLNKNDLNKFGEFGQNKLLIIKKE